MLWSVLSHRALRRRDRSAGVARAGIFFLYAGRWYNHNIDYDIFEPVFGFSLTNVAGAVLCCRFLVVRCDKLGI
jgi:hypothetical protein